MTEPIVVATSFRGLLWKSYGLKPTFLSLLVLLLVPLTCLCAFHHPSRKDPWIKKVSCANRQSCLSYAVSIPFPFIMWMRRPWQWIWRPFLINSMEVEKGLRPWFAKSQVPGLRIETGIFQYSVNRACGMAGHADNSRPTFFLRTYGSGGQVCVEIRDNGPGMSQNIRRRIFEPVFPTNGHGRPGLSPRLSHNKSWKKLTG